jgi:predicted molibdopterin-dependent oxidoreductase YjgC
MRDTIGAEAPFVVDGNLMQTRAMDSKFNIAVNGRPVAAEAGQTVAATLLSAGITAFRRTPNGAPRGIFCGMGVCYDCLVTVDGLADQRACVTPVRPGMRVQLDVA